MKQNRISEALLRLASQPRALAKTLSTRIPGAVAQGVTVVSLDGQWLKLLQVEGLLGSRVITKALACPVEGVGAEALQQRVKKACADEQVIPRDVLIANPTHLCTVRMFSLPSTDPKEIRDIVDLQAEKHTPYAKEEILTDFTILDRGKSGYSRILLIIAHQDVIHRPVGLAETCGWTIDRVGCELEGLVRWSRLAKKESAAKGGPSLVVEVDGGTTTLLVVARGQPQFQRSLATGVVQLEADPVNAGERLIGELQRSVDALDAEGGTPKIQDVVLTGPIERLGELKTQVEQGLDLPVRLVSPWEGAQLSEGARAALARLPDVSFASLAGLVSDQGEIDLTPPATKLRLAFEERAKAIVLLGCQFLAVLILLSLLLIGRAQKEERYFTKLSALYEVITPQAGEVEASLQQLVFIEEQLRRRSTLLKAIDTLASLSPTEVQWNSLSFTQGGAIVLSGTAEQLPRVYEFSGSVGSSPLFGLVEAKRVATRKTGEKDVTDFELHCPLATAETATKPKT